jgi:hypothetical protein
MPFLPPNCYKLGSIPQFFFLLLFSPSNSHLSLSKSLGCVIYTIAFLVTCAFLSKVLLSTNLPPPKHATHNDLMTIIINYLNWSTLTPIVTIRIIITECSKLYLRHDKNNDVCHIIGLVMQKQPKLCHH